jgi:hypothetical protein
LLFDRTMLLAHPEVLYLVTVVLAVQGMILWELVKANVVQPAKPLQ